MSKHNLHACRLLLDGPHDGAWNMAVDEALLEGSAAQRQACCRFYAWDTPTLSLGYFQDYAQRWQHAASGSCPAVRRLTGGGAILHDAELTYSIALPLPHPLATRRDRLYAVVHGCLIDALARLGIAATLCGQNAELQGANCKLQIANSQSQIPDLKSQISSPQSQDPRPKTQDPRPKTKSLIPNPFLCFHRRTRGDVLLGDEKIAGSAQRRRSGAVMQHGSLLLRRSAAAEELAGLEDLAGRAVPRETVQSLWLEQLARHLGVRWREGRLGEAESLRAAALVETRYACPRWTERLRRR
jgi:lipoate-protein ligase A